MRETDKGRFRPTNPHKYIGDVNNIIFRSGWEREVFKWLDSSSTVIGWNSEELVIPYINVLDRTPHRYFPDIFARIVRNGKIVPTLIEIKPAQFSVKPIKGKRQSKKTYTEAIQRYYTNGSKWLAAKKFCEEKGWEFLLLCKDTNTNKFEVKNHLLEQAIIDAKQVISG
jgi:hypothetical protein